MGCSRGISIDFCAKMVQYTPMKSVPGLWYEASRDRWRVLIRRDGDVYHRSYHRDYDEALTKWTQVMHELKMSMPRKRGMDMSAVGQFLRLPARIAK